MTERQDIRRLQQGLRRVKGASGADGTDGVDGVDGATGPTGATGPAGADGEGVALGGTANQALTKIDGTDFNTQWSTIDNTFVGSEPADNTILKDADIGGSVQAFSSNLDTYAVNSLTAAELGELQNINTVTVTNAQWAFLGAFDQGLTTTSNVSFGAITASGIISVAAKISLSNNTGFSSLGTNATGTIRTSTANGLSFEGKGSTNDMIFSAGSGITAMRIPTGTGHVIFAGVVKSGAGVTGSRPTPQGAGSMWFDTTLGIPIWHDGTNWIDATGITV